VPRAAVFGLLRVAVAVDFGLRAAGCGLWLFERLVTGDWGAEIAKRPE
jgi:hypothetical protein